MKRFNKIFILLLIIFCSFAFLVSCSDNKNEKDQNPSSEIKDENNNSSDNETGDNETGDNDDSSDTSSSEEIP